MENTSTNPFTDDRVELRHGLYSEILPGLWQGGTHPDEHRVVSVPSHNARHIGCDEFDVVGTFYHGAQPVSRHVMEYRYPFNDGDMTDINIGYVMQIALHMHTEWKSGKRVLSRCQAGWNRSGLLTALVLIIEGYSAEAAIDLIRRRRSEYALCNGTFERFVREFTPGMLNPA